MWNYLKQAFWFRERVPLLGDLPVNVMALGGMAMLGFANPGFWLLGLALETAFLWAMVSNDRFRALVDARDLQQRREVTDSQQEKELDVEGQTRLGSLRAQLGQVEQAYARFPSGSDDFAARENLAFLRSLADIYLRLLLARQHLVSPRLYTVGEAQVRSQLAALEQELAGSSPRLGETLRASKEATRELLRQRLHMHERRDESVREIDSDLSRIENQFQLAAESAALNAKPVTLNLSLDLDFASSMIASMPALESAPEAPPANRQAEPI